MEITVNKIQIKGFKSIKEMDIVLKPINIIVGQNGAGKSNFVGVFKFLNKIVNKELQDYIRRNGGDDRFFYFGNKVTNQIEISLFLKNNTNSYEISLVSAVPNTLYINKEIVRYLINNNYTDLGQGFESRLKEDDTYKCVFVKNFLEGIKIYHFHDVGDNAPIKKSCKITDNLFLQSQADNLPAMLYRFKKYNPYEYNKIVEVVKMVAPFFQDFILEPEENNIMLRWKHIGYDKIFDVYDLSSGTLRFVALATLLLQPINCIANTILIDEPELGLHPYSLKILAELFKSVTKKDKQIIATSQSIEFINEFSYEDIIVVDRKDETSYFRRLEEKEVKEWLNEFSIGDIWGRNIIGGTPNDY